MEVVGVPTLTLSKLLLLESSVIGKALRLQVVVLRSALKFAALLAQCISQTKTATK